MATRTTRKPRASRSSAIHTDEWGWGSDAVIPLSQLFVEYFDDDPGKNYQRSPTRVEQFIINNYDPLLVGRLIVAAVEKNGKKNFAIIDGATRWRAMQELGMTHAPCVVLGDLTLPQRAEKFLQANTWSKTLRPIDKYRALLAMGDEACLRMQKIFDVFDISVSEGAATKNSLAAIATARNIYNAGGEELLERTLKVISEAWPEARRRYSGSLLGGIAHFLRLDDKRTSEDKLIARLASLETADLARQASDLRTGSGHGGGSHVYIARGVAMFIYGASAKTKWPEKKKENNADD